MATTPNGMRASDAERERVAAIRAGSGAEGRLTLTEAEDRLGAVYTTKYQDELAALTTDLPSTRSAFSPLNAARAPLSLRVHAVIAVLLAVLLIVRWSVSAVPIFWPIAPMFWLALSLVVHARLRGVRWRRTAVVPY